MDLSTKMGGTNRSFRFRIWVFVAISYIFTWAFWLSARFLGDANIAVSLQWHENHGHLQIGRLLEWIGILGPSVGLLVMLVFFPTSVPKRQTLKGMLNLRVKPVFYVFALVAPFVAFFTESLIRGLKGTPTFFLGGPVSWCIDVLEYFFLSPFWEEIGWRGFLLPEMESQYGNFAASLWVGLIWGAWHVPLRIYTAPPRSSPFAFVALFVIYCVGLSIVLTWLYNASGKSVITCVIFHAAVNAAGDSFVTPEASAYGGLSSFEGALVSVWVLAAVILLIDRINRKTVFWPDRNSSLECG
ncbi:MAG TPA: CPBP family intramembrane glutamic endopeptidase [Verrucomicrobiae bacterium]|nr:CPBP family intramembrane glutamic endopeptidase [Verrucomicrobiae bacterium]